MPAETLPIENSASIVEFARSSVEIGCVLIMMLAPIAAIYYARSMKRPFIGQGVIHFLAISEIIPAIVILGLEQVLDKAATGTLLAGVAGYVLGGMGDNRNAPKGPTSSGNNSQPPSSGPSRPSPEDNEDDGPFGQLGHLDFEQAQSDEQTASTEMNTEQR